jgi:F420-dependent oxidoreductase-like protein
VRLGIHFASFTLPGQPADLGGTLAATAAIAEDIGCSWFTLVDHYFQVEPFATAQDPMLEGYTALGFLAGQTKRMALGLLVTGVTYRHPGLLAKIVTTLDVLSRGRAMLGLGVAWYEREHAGLGVPYPPVTERFERLEETLQICQQMWSDNDGPYQGKHYQLAETICVPQPLQQPHPPIVIGGTGERKTLRLVAKYADGTNMFALGHDAIRAKLDVLTRHCDTEGRDPASIQKTILPIGDIADPLGDPDGFLAAMDGYAKLGIDHVQLMPIGPDPVGYVTQLGDLVPRLADLG